MLPSSAVCAALVLGAVLLSSGIAKLTVARAAVSAVAEVLPGIGAGAAAIVRVVAVVEVLAAVALAVPPARVAGLATAVILGFAFAGAGGLGLLRKASKDCGCFGRAGGKPLGARAVGVGLLIAAAAALALTQGGNGPDWIGDVPLNLSLTAALTVLFTGWLYRDLIRDLVRPPRAQSASAKGASA
ncbi:MauE/DoxX family redox-associated membrane protein [Dactylosporangium sp. NPDC051485]|uniref:MauE/DoxX family redox-associated membrane protein n=1 Tax=Dactylosporangium sp. NPDC051485 TaxID=3154846 RepID=UPI00343BCED2